MAWGPRHSLATTTPPSTPNHHTHFTHPHTHTHRARATLHPNKQKNADDPGPIAVKAAVLTIVEKLAAAGRGRLYAGPITSPGGALYALLTVAALDLLHDAWFYATHRLLHSRALYRPIHAMHHLSVAPTAFTGYAFHPLEAALVFANEVAVCFLFPIHAGLHRAYHLWTTIIHNGGHAGYEIAPFIPSIQQLAWRLAGRAGHPAALATVAHHDLHHRFPTRHFALYFTHWDRWCGTEHPAYRPGLEAAARAVAEAGEAAAAAKAAKAAAGSPGGSAGGGGDKIRAWRGGGEDHAAAAAVGPASPRGAARRAAVVGGAVWH
jgi:Delta7-sterol 5-desaturase